MAFIRSYPRLLGFCLLLAVLIADQWSKAAVSTAGFDRSPRDILPFFSLVLVHNRGISFGLFTQVQAAMPWALTATTSAVAAGLLIWLARANDWFITLALGFIIGGALGNIIDRLRLGAVTDFLDFHLGGYHWPAFNLADSAIFIGVVILLLISIVGPSAPKEEP
jgi:signal peptidase II